jgi:hypothetical protein
LYLYGQANVNVNSITNSLNNSFYILCGMVKFEGRLSRGKQRLLRIANQFDLSALPSVEQSMAIIEQYTAQSLDILNGKVGRIEIDRSAIEAGSEPEQDAVVSGTVAE